MRWLDDYRDAETVHALADAVRREMTRPWTLMEICGGQTHAILRHGLDQLLPPELTLVHGPGCPVCVTSARLIDAAIALARRPEVILCSFGDMMRVPGSGKDLSTARAAGADVRPVYSPMDALRVAEACPEREIVFFAVGFETTAPATALALHQARTRGLRNFSLLSAHVLVPPAMEAILSSPENQVHAFLAAGHVCAVTGWDNYLPVATRHRVPVVITGFEPVDLLHGVLRAVRQLEAGRAEAENAYGRWVRRDGNPAARALLAEAFRTVPREWRGLGWLPDSGWDPAERYVAFDAARKFLLPTTASAAAPDASGCLSGLVLQGRLKPDACPHFGTRCTPEHPLGATMVSDEGACAAYFRYRRHAEEGSP
jgi:hydrogenase expression/formation protein HypD